MTAVNDLRETYELVVVGAGPAGLSAATTAAEQGISVLLIDENASIGGQVYRDITTTPVRDKSILGQDYWQGKALAARFAAASVSYLPKAVVWSVAGQGKPNGGFEVGLSRDGAARLIGADQCILATGALERPFPVPGWTLPGVMTAGAAQTLLKTSGLIPGGRIVLAGCGPLLYVLAQTIVAAGGRLSAILDTTPRSNWRAALPWFGEFLTTSYFTKGLRLLASVRRHTRIISGVTDIVLEGADQRVETIRFRRQGGRGESFAVDAVLLHQGVMPAINLSNAAGCVHDWDPVRLCLFPRIDETFQSTMKGLAIAGDGAGIGGAEAAALAGEIAAIGALHRLGRISIDERDGRLWRKRREWTRKMRGRGFIDRLYRPAKQFRIPEDPATVVCRCEDVTAGRVRQTIADGCAGPNQLKSFTRCGMGACQGRLCGVTVTEMISDIQEMAPAEVGYFQLRPPVKPVTLAELAALHRQSHGKNDGGDGTDR